MHLHSSRQQDVGMQAYADPNIPGLDDTHNFWLQPTKRLGSQPFAEAWLHEGVAFRNAARGGQGKGGCQLC
jgi:hypothetical protein